MDKKILILNNEPDICNSLEKLLLPQGFKINFHSSGDEILDLIRELDPQIILLDLSLPNGRGMQLLQTIRKAHSRLPVVVISPDHALEKAVAAMKLGASDFLLKPIDSDQLLTSLQEAHSIRRDVRGDAGPPRPAMEQPVWVDAAMQKAMEWVERIAPFEVSVLLRGESGTGKEMIARYIHQLSPRAGQAFISVDCSALPVALVEAELFGYERGAFTDAYAAKPGRFEAAQSGTLFLDEIGNLPLTVQAKLLRVLQERRFQRLGGREEITLRTRLITATNSDLEKIIQAGNFREELYHRMNEFEIQLPPLRDRGADLDLLARYFLAQCNHEFGKNLEGFAPAVWEIFHAYAWPGNVRELRNAIRRAAILANRRIETPHLPADLLAAGYGFTAQDSPNPAAETRSLKRIRQEASRRLERETILRALAKTRWNKAQAARLLKINYKTLFNKMKELGI